MFLSIPLRNPFAKIISIMSKNRAHQSYLILNYGGFCEIFSQNARNIHAESVSIWKFLRWVLLASERAPASPTSTASPHARASPFTIATKFPLLGKHSFRGRGISHTLYIMYRKHRCRLCGVAIGLLRIRLTSRRLCLCGHRLWRFACKEPVAPAAHSCCLYGEDKVVVVLAVEEWHKALLAGKALVDQ